MSATPNHSRPSSGAQPKKGKGAKPISVSPDTAPLKKRMTVDKHVVEELLLVCGVLGTVDEDTGQLVPVEDCLNWLQDLQRALRRDDDQYRPISILLGQWKVVQQKLLPLVLSCRYDSALVLTICKILVILTKPLANNTLIAGRYEINGKKTDSLVVKHQIDLRENAIKQADTLMEYKRAFCFHPSHRSRPGQKKNEGGILSVFVSLLAEPLAKQGTSRTESDHLTIELVLHLFRNLLQAEPLVYASADTAQEAQELHHEFINLIDRELFLDILQVLCADLEQRENAPYNLLLMEILDRMIKHQDPSAVAKVSTPPPPRKGQGSLKTQLSRERKALDVFTASRHSNFGGTLQMKGRPGERGKYKSASSALFTKTESSAGVPYRRKNKNMDCFIGTSVTLQVHARSNCRPTVGLAAKAAHQTLHKFCQRFVRECYGPVMKSLKNEFRRDSVRLEDSDRVVFFRIVWFFSQWWRSGGRKSLANDATGKEVIGQLIFTMDIFTFNMVLNAIDTFHQHKKHARLVTAVSLLSEMLHLLHVMYQSKEPTENLMAIGLMDRLYFNSDPLDRLPKLLSNWSPGTNTREHLCDIAEIVYMTLKLLELSSKACRNVEHTDKKDTVSKLKMAAANFDVEAYFIRKLVSNHSVFMFIHLFSQYAVNATQVNHRIISFFLRMCKVKLAVPDELDASTGDSSSQPRLRTKKVTLEPMLYRLQFLTTANTILNDKSIAKDPEYKMTLDFCTRIIHSFAQLAAENPMLYAEVLFKHTVPHRFCDQVTNIYVTEELRMLADRELLLERQRHIEQQYNDAMAFEDEEESTGEQELAEDQAPLASDHPQSVENRPKEAIEVRKRVIDDVSSDEEVEFDGNIETGIEPMPPTKRPRHIADDSDEE